MYGVGFTKHNTNAGFVDEDLHRITPQVRSNISNSFGFIVIRMIINVLTEVGIARWYLSIEYPYYI